MDGATALSSRASLRSGMPTTAEKGYGALTSPYFHGLRDDLPVTTDAGYSGTPLVRKLGIKPGHRVAFVNAPEEFSVPGTDGARIETSVTTSISSYDVILVFCPDSIALHTHFQRLAAVLVPNGALWVCWPKRASGVPTDLDENVVRDWGLAAGLVDVKVCAVDATWSGLKFVVRLADRERRP
jgi:hypothetical protein